MTVIDPDDARAWEMTTDYGATWNHCTVSARSPLALMANRGDIKPGMVHADFPGGRWYRWTAL